MSARDFTFKFLREHAGQEFAVGELAEQLGIKRPTVSKAIKTLGSSVNTRQVREGKSTKTFVSFHGEDFTVKEDIHGENSTGQLHGESHGETLADPSIVPDQELEGPTIEDLQARIQELVQENRIRKALEEEHEQDNLILVQEKSELLARIEELDTKLTTVPRDTKSNTLAEFFLRIWPTSEEALVALESYIGKNRSIRAYKKQLVNYGKSSDIITFHEFFWELILFRIRALGE